MSQSRTGKQSRRFCQTMVGMDEHQYTTPLSQILAYHQRTKHSVEGYALGPASLDWDAQPSPYRDYEGTEKIQLPFSQPTASYNALFDGSINPSPLTLKNIAQLLEYSLSLAAVKVFGQDSWTVRINPSSGNLHPTEAYLLCGELEGLQAGLYHYQSQHHQLEKRADSLSPLPANSGYIALSSIYWREAWKYGERAYRYCQLDVGHAIAAIRYSAALLGWQVTIESQLNDDILAQLCGIDRNGEFEGVEKESPDLLLRIHPSPSLQVDQLNQWISDAQWYGQPTVLDSHPFYEWQIIEQVSKACHKGVGSSNDEHPLAIPQLPGSEANAGTLIKQRRSALAFRPEVSMDKEHFFGILQALLPEQRHLPFELLNQQAKLHPVLFVHRVEGISPGLYCLPRHSQAKDSLQQAMDEKFEWQAVTPELPLYLLQQGDAQAICKRISCHQAIASDSAFSLGMLAEFSGTLENDNDAWRYRQLYWEGGIIGQTLYLEAEAHGFRGTGIGCFLDDLFHQLLGLTDQQYQSLYHFTVGAPVVDERISTLSPYKK